jgi:hypothetical protein
MTTIRRVTIAVTTALLVTLAAAACTGGGAPDADDPTTAPSPTATEAAMTSAAPEPSSTPAPASIPTDCTDVVDAATYASTLASTPLNDPVTVGERPSGQLQPTTAPAGSDAGAVVVAATQLDCLWRDPRADITGLNLAISSVDAATQEAFQAWLLDRANQAPVARDAGASYTCEPGYDGTLCQMSFQDPLYGVEIAETALLRDGVVVQVGQANFPTDDLMGALVARIWG